MLPLFTILHYDCSRTSSGAKFTTTKKTTKKEAAKKEENKKTTKKVDLSSLTVAELKKMAKDKNVNGYSTMKKAELINALK